MKGSKMATDEKTQKIAQKIIDITQVPSPET